MRGSLLSFAGVKNRRPLLFCGFLLLSMGAASQVRAQSGPNPISIQFVGNGTAMGTSEVAGVAPLSNWNAEQGASGSYTGLADSTGSTTTAQVSWTADNTWEELITDQPGNYRMMLGYLDNGNEDTTTVTVSGLPSSADGYYVFVYADGDNSDSSRTGVYQISGSGITTTSISLTDAANTNFGGTFTQANNSAGNYVEFTIPDVSGFTLSAIPSTSSTGTERAPVNGIQIVPVGSLGPDFTLSASPGTQTVSAGGGTTYTVNVGAVNGFSGSVSLSASGLPSGATASFSPASVNGSGSSTLTVTTSTSTPSGGPTLTITGTSGSLIHTTAVTLVVVGSSTNAISIQFVGNGTAMGSSEVAGVAAAGNWNPEQGASGSATGLVDSTGSSTTAQASWTADNPWAESITDQPGNYRLMLGYLDNGEESTTTVAVSGLPSSSGGYNVYVYANGDTTGWNTGTYQISGTGITTTSIGLTYTGDFNGTFTQANNSVGNYVVFTIPNVSGFTLSAIPGAASSGYERAPVNGIQIVPIGGEGGGGTVANPSISPVSGSYVSPQTITVSDATSGATICVRTDGGTPTASTPGACDSPATAFSSGGNFSLTIPSGGATVEALGTLAGYTNSGVATNSYSLAAQAGQPGFSPAAGTYTSTQTVTISASSGAIICWNTTGSPGPINGGSTCPAGSTLINGSSGTITVSSSETVYAVAGGSGYSDSSLGSASYTLNLGPQVYYYIEGSLGTARVMTDSTGTVCYDADFYPYGGERVVTGSCPQNYKFTGKERDSESGLDNFGARYNSSQYGRFMSPDPYNAGANPTDPQTWNMYSYVRNNPLSMIDPSGLAQCYWNDGPSDTDPTVPGDANPACDDQGGWTGNPEDCDADICVTSNHPFPPDPENWVDIDTSWGNIGGPLWGLSPAAPSPRTPSSLPNNGTKTCSVSARLLKGNSATIGMPGGFSGNTPAKNILVTANGAAVVPSQWGGKAVLRPYLSQISGDFPTVGASFQGIVDIVGGAPPKGFPPDSDTGQDLIGLNPLGTVIIELPGSPEDYGTANGTITMPNSAKCPG